MMDGSYCLTKQEKNVKYFTPKPIAIALIQLHNDYHYLQLNPLAKFDFFEVELQGSLVQNLENSGYSDLSFYNFFYIKYLI